jgi:Fic family protein
MNSSDSLHDSTKMASFDPRQADAAYKPFPPLEEWLKCPVDTGRWDRYTANVRNRSQLSKELLQRAAQVVAKAAAIDTGAIEGLYDTDRGFTFTVATETALWQAVVEERKGPKVLALIESQLNAYDYVLDFATNQVPLGEAWIRTLHEQICRSQETYGAYTEIGFQELALPKGEYKHLPNHVLGKDGKIHSYAPVDLTPAEMHRLCAELNSEAFLAAHPILQSSYAHHAFASIHPFADGNGRVGRALASVFTYRASSTPLLILAEDRVEYLTSLRAADEGNYQAFVNLTLEKALDAIQLFDQSLRTAKTPPAEDSLAKLKRLYVTKGGYSHKQVDEAGYKLMDLFAQEVENHRPKVAVEGMVGFTSSPDAAGHPIASAGYRHPLNGPRRVIIQISTAAPAATSVSRAFGLEVPKDCGKDVDLIIRNTQSNEGFEVRITELIPVHLASVQMMIALFVEGLINEMLGELSVVAAKALRG